MNQYLLTNTSEMADWSHQGLKFTWFDLAPNLDSANKSYLHYHNVTIPNQVTFLIPIKKKKWCAPFWKYLLTLLQHCFWGCFVLFCFVLFCFVLFCFVDHKACGILAAQPWMKLTHHALKSEVLTSGLPGKSLPYSHFIDKETEVRRNVCDLLTFI